MFGAVTSLFRRDLESQAAWAREEFHRNARSTAVTTVLLVLATFAAVGAGIVGCMALYHWVELRHGPMAGFAAVGGLLFAGALLLLAIATWRPQPPALPRPLMASTNPEVLKQAFRQDVQQGTEQVVSQVVGLAKASSIGPAFTAGEEALRTGTTMYKAARSHFRDGSTGSVLGSIAVVAVIGLVLGRRL